MESWGATESRFEDLGLCHETDVACAERVAMTQSACERIEAATYLADARSCGETGGSPDGAAECTESARRRFISRVRSCTERS